MGAVVLEKLDELIAEQKRSNDLLESLLENSDAARRMVVVGDAGPGLEMIAGELLVQEDMTPAKLDRLIELLEKLVKASDANRQLVAATL